MSHEVQPAELEMSEKPKRRWYQFSLLAILILMGAGPILLTFLYFAIIDFQKAARKPRQPEFKTLDEIFEEAKKGP